MAIVANQESIRCRCCNGLFDADELAGSYLDRRCPLCGSRLSEDGYDADAARLCSQRKELALEERRLEENASKTRQRVEAIRWWQLLFRRKWQRQAGEAEAQLEECRRSLHATNDDLKNLPACRYYAGEWYQLTRMPLSNRDPAEGPRYRLEASFSPAGSFRLRGRDAYSSGLEGEHFVFELLRRRVVAPESPLSGARLLPNLYLPRDGSDEDMREGRWRQVDCAVATTRGLFVVEVKRWNARVSTSSGYRMLFVERNDENNGLYAPADQVTGQLEQTAAALRDLSPYPPGRVFRAAVFVRPKGFESDAEGFVGQSLVSFADYDRAPFVGAIEQKLAELDDVFDADDVAHWADSALVAYGDLSGEYRSRAEQRRAEARSHRGTHHRSKGGTRSKSARKHQIAKKQRSKKGIRCSKRGRIRSIDDEWGWYLDGVNRQFE